MMFSTSLVILVRARFLDFEEEVLYGLASECVSVSVEYFGRLILTKTLGGAENRAVLFWKF